MSQLLKAIADGFRFNDRVAGAVTAGFEAADWFRRPEAGGNHAVWILGHLAGSRRFLLKLLGMGLEPPAWPPELFVMGGELKPDDAYPAPDALMEDFLAAGGRLVERLETMTPEEAEVEMERAFPSGGRTRAGGAQFLFFHESYHLGQLGYIRRMGGRSGFA